MFCGKRSLVLEGCDLGRELCRLCFERWHLLFNLGHALVGFSNVRKIFLGQSASTEKFFQLLLQSRDFLRKFLLACQRHCEVWSCFKRRRERLQGGDYREVFLFVCIWVFGRRDLRLCFYGAKRREQ